MRSVLRSEIRNIILASFHTKNCPFPLFGKEGWNRTEKIPPLKKGDQGGFEFNVSGCHRLDFLNELLSQHTRFTVFNYDKSTAPLCWWPTMASN